MAKFHFPVALIGIVRAKTIQKYSKVNDSLIELQDGRQEDPLGADTLTNPTRYGDWEIKGRCIDF